MIDSSTPANGPYPSRRSLREAAEALSQRTEEPAAETVAEQESATVREPTAMPSAPDAAPRTNSVRLPRLEHVPVVALDAVEAKRERPSIGRRLASLAATASVCGLVVALAFPFANPPAAEGDAAAAAQQRLFSELSAEELPASLTEITAAEIDDSTPQSYAFRPEALVNYPFASPVMLTDGFGYRTAPVEQFHDAQDFAAAAGTPIQVIADGTVLEAGQADDGCGFGLKVEHRIDGKTVTSRYCHMQDGSHTYSVGDTVKMGDPAGKVGNTGMSFGPHLHLALRVNDEPVDPMPFFAKYTRMDRPKDGKDAEKPTVQAEAAPPAQTP
ncbi:M23 family metallopeptidase [Leucobacter ruminantium]|nr:M23 family metallopeptidase [Leucobacter ruminantium]